VRAGKGEALSPGGARGSRRCRRRRRHRCGAACRSAGRSPHPRTPPTPPAKMPEQCRNGRTGGRAGGRAGGRVDGRAGGQVDGHWQPNKRYTRTHVCAAVVACLHGQGKGRRSRHFTADTRVRAAVRPATNRSISSGAVAHCNRRAATSAKPVAPTHLQEHALLRVGHLGLRRAEPPELRVELLRAVDRAGQVQAG
jgi:hypothetical protein